MVAVAMETGLGLPSGSDAAGGGRLDLRLVGPAVAVWGGAAAAGYWGFGPVLLGAAGMVLCACPVGVLIALHQGPGGRLGRPGALVAFVTLAFLAAGVLVGGAAARPRFTGPLAEMARAHRTVNAEVVLSDDPKISAAAAPAATSGPREGATVTARARLEAVTEPGRRLRASVPVLLVGRGSDLANYLPGQRLSVRAGLAPAGPGDTIATVLFVRAPPRARGRPDAVQRAAGWLRAGLRDAADVVPQPAGGLLPALVVGDTSGLDPGLKDDFRTAGMSHLTAVSGANLAITAGTVLFLLGRLRLGARSRAVAAALVLVGFVILARPSASVVRAGAMGLVGLVALAAGRPRAVLAALATAVIAVVMADPAFALSAGFALSVLATTGMIVWGPGWSDALERGRAVGRLGEVVAVAAAAQLACTPVLAWLGGGISIVAIPANVVAAPAVAPATVLGVSAMAVAAVNDPVAALLARLAGLACRWLVLVADVAAGVPAATIGWPAGLAGAATALGCVVLVVALARRRPTRWLLVSAVVGLLAARVLLLPRLAGWPPPGWRLVACDVGQGDGLVLRAGPASAVVVDVGPDPALIAACLDDLGVREVPLLMLTHLHTDHAAGLSGVVGRLPVGELVVSPLPEPADQWDAVERAARAAGVPVRAVTAGAAGETGAVRWRVIGPERVLRGTASDPNNASLVVLAAVGGVTILLTGDAEPPEQRQVARRGLGPVDVLKVAHHGSEDQLPEFLTRTGAEVALISVGVDNTYGHPAPSTLAGLRAAGMAVARTDLHGTVAVVETAGGGVRAVARRPGPRGGGAGS
ncbi:DNA internalization-related competence protein ComEC/Rec2 [Parafrankia sp. Ea1.12]|uniref:ComEC/Rec2 family competence protein n=1 Tax=Parafrankia sp. Ea1.12 TaxID=573499 RepID=UPI000DA5659E|nr:ComEC/Rec2 family competence protein [Parafrankia sp. Ea1.12]SQD96986.1 DNA internalization-related competence protein ComEC/Rec2 [Parafrankia sp. Ea1.12]